MSFAYITSRSVLEKWYIVSSYWLREKERLRTQNHTRDYLSMIVYNYAW